MLHFRCVACRLRLATPIVSKDRAGGACPGCGVPLEPVADLAEIVGFRAIDDDSRASRWLDADGGFSREAVAAALASFGVTTGGAR
jgi:hypothetical protein